LDSKGTERRLAAILAADVVGYSRLVSADETNALTRLASLRTNIIEVNIANHSGRLFKVMGDGFLAEFASAVEAVNCAIAIQAAAEEAASGLDDNQKMRLRIGVHLGDVIVEGDDLMGDGINIAARLEGIADAGGISISRAVHDQVRDRINTSFDNKGEVALKNIARPVQVFALSNLNGGETTSPPRPNAILALPNKPSIVVLPFDNLSADPGQDYLADGIVEAITAALSRIGSFFVIARNSAFAYKGRAVNVRNIGKELGVAYLLEGSVQKASNRIRIILQLIETEGGMHIWTEHYDGTIDDIFDLQDQITEQVAGALQPSIRFAEIERSRRKRPQDLCAYDYAMRAMPHVWALEKEESAKALELLDKAMAIDSRYPLALSLAGWCHAQRSVYNWAEDISGSQTLALHLAERAAELSGDDPLILSVLGAVHTFVRNHGTARILLERALALDPNSAWAWSRLGWIENYSDHSERGLENFARALRLSPLDPMNFNNYVGMASAHEIAQEYDEAAALYRRALEERPHAAWIYRNLASSLAGAGRMEEARTAFAEMARSYPGLTATHFRQAMVFSASTLDRMIDNLKKLGLPD
jgi:adenylate cyclase